MYNIEFLSIVDGPVTLQLLKPASQGGDSSQHVVTIKTPSESGVACILGDMVFQGLLHCASLLAEDLIADNIENRTVHSENSRSYQLSMDVEKVANTNEYLFGFRGLGGQIEALSSLSDEYLLPAFRIPLTTVETACLGRLFQRLEYEQFSPALISKKPDWFHPTALDLDWRSAPLEEARHLQLVELTKSYVAQYSPAAISREWRAFLETLQLDFPALHQCTECAQFFAAKKVWLKACLGCYRGSRPTAYSMEKIMETVVLEPWIEEILEAEDDVVGAESRMDWRFF